MLHKLLDVPDQKITLCQADNTRSEALLSGNLTIKKSSPALDVIVQLLLIQYLSESAVSKVKVIVLQY